jgi:hypothetical protein
VIDRVDGIVPPFSLVSTSPPLPATLQPGDVLEVSIQFDATNQVSVSAVRAGIVEPCDTTVEAQVRGSGESGASAVVFIPDMAATIGERLLVEPQLSDAAGLDDANAHQWRAEIAVESSVLTVADNSPWREENDERIVTIEGNRPASSTDLNGQVMMTATLGRVVTSPVRLVSFEWIDVSGTVDMSTKDGEFTLLGLCREGGVRLYDPDGSIGIKSITPNPASTSVSVEYELSEAGRTRMTVVSVDGREAAVLFDGQMVPGRYELQLSDEIPAEGTYWLVLETPTARVTKAFQIAR